MLNWITCDSICFKIRAPELYSCLLPSESKGICKLETQRYEDHNLWFNWIHNLEITHLNWTSCALLSESKETNLQSRKPNAMKIRDKWNWKICESGFTQRKSQLPSSIQMLGVAVIRYWILALYINIYMKE